MRRLIPLALLAAAAQAPPPAPSGARELRLVMGTTAEIAVDGLADPVPAFDAAFAALARVDEAMSLWKPSELQRLNDAGGGRLTPDLQAVLAHALDLAADSGGAFDPTVEPLVRADGGFGAEKQTLTKAQRAALLARVGYRQIRLEREAGAARFLAGARLDFGGIAKGYAVDLALLALQAAGARAGFVALGESSIRVFGQPMLLETRDPEAPEAEPWASFRLDAGAISTSAEDQRHGHILDPRTGQPAQAVLAATVVAVTGIEADALSTAVFVLGAEEGLALLTRRGASGFVLYRVSGERVLRATPGFAAARSLRLAPGVRLVE